MIEYLADDVIDPQPLVVRGGAPWYELGNVDGGVVADVWVVDAPCDAEAESGAPTLKNDLVVLPVVDGLD